MLIRASKEKCNFVFEHKFKGGKSKSSPDIMRVTREDIFEKLLEKYDYVDAANRTPEQSIISTDTFIMEEYDVIANATFKHHIQPYYTRVKLIEILDKKLIIHFVKGSNPDKWDKQYKEYKEQAQLCEYILGSLPMFQPYFNGDNVEFKFHFTDGEYNLIYGSTNPPEDFLPPILDSEGNFIFNEKKALTRECSKCDFAYGCTLIDCKTSEFNIFSLDGRDWRTINKYIKDNGTVEVDVLDEKTLNKIHPSSKNRYLLHKQGKKFIHTPELSEFIEDIIGQELNHFDFETYIDPREGFKQVPFSYSSHFTDKGNDIRNHKFDISKGKIGTDEYYRFIKEMAGRLDNDRNIVAYNKTFEKTVFAFLADRYPEFKDIFMSAIERLIDLYDIFNKGYALHIDMNKVGLKDAHKAICGDAYNKLDVDNGVDASLLYHKMLVNNEFNEEDINKIREYNTQDTLSQIELIEEIAGILLTEAV